MTLKADCRSLIIFLLCLLNVVNIRAQCDRPNVGDNRVLTAESTKQSYSEGETATFQCSVGYQPVDPSASSASRSVTCSGNKWTELKLQCRKKRCGPLPEISNGGYVYSPEGDDGVLFGATATAQCKPGYQLAGQADRAVRYCRDAGWDGRDHSCEAVQCLPPPQIANGDIDEDREDQYDYGRAVSYKCSERFTLFGNKTLSCSEDGTFQPSPPECIEVSCSPPTVHNGTKIAGRAPYGYKSFIEFECNSGFKMVGSGYLVCERNKWNPPPPICTAPVQTTTRRPTSTTSAEREATTRRPTRPTSSVTKDEGKNNVTPTSDGVKTGPIIGGIVAVAVGGIVIGGIAWYYYKKRSSSDGYTGNVATKSEEGPL